jgi:hypothetical protein
MGSIRVETTVQADGELLLSHLPFHKGDRVEAIITLNPESEEEKRAMARKAFLELAGNSKFRSVGPYPTREELHERD